MTKEIYDRIDDSEAIIIGVGKEFALDYEEILKSDQLYLSLRDKLDFLKGSQILDEAVYNYIKYSIIYHEIISGENKVIKEIKNAYDSLFFLLKDKYYFLVTTCTDDIIFTSEFPMEKITAPCGSISLLHDSCNCKGEFIDASETYKKIYDILMRDGLDIENIKKEIPVCDQCGSMFIPNIHGQPGYDENGYKAQWELYTRFLQRTLNKKLTMMELGVDFSTPTVIRWPFEKIAFLNNKAYLIRINKKFYQLTEEISNKGIAVEENALSYAKNIKAYN